MGAGFTRPVVLSASGFGAGSQFAVNDRGEAVAVSVSAGETYCTGEPRPEPGRLVVQRIGSSGVVGEPQTLTMPGFFNVSSSQQPSVAPDELGNVATGLVYQDASSPSGCVPHSSECCAHAAIASLRPGGALELQVLPPPDGNGKPGNALGPPVVAVNHGMLAAVWEWNREPSGTPGESLGLLDQASGPFGSPLRVAPLTSRPLRVSALHLALGSSASAAWLGSARASQAETGALYQATPDAAGMLEAPARGRRLFGTDGQAIGFADDEEGDTAFAYEPTVDSEAINDVIIASSSRGHRFARSRVIGRVRGLTQPNVVGGGRHSLMFTWVDESNRIFAQRGTVFGAFGRPTYVANSEGSYDAFLDDRGRAIIVFDRRVSHRRGLWEEVAVVARRGGRFAPAHRIAPPLTAGSIGLGPSLAAVSPNGTALILIGRELGRKYMTLYKP